MTRLRRLPGRIIGYIAGAYIGLLTIGIPRLLARIQGKRGAPNDSRQRRREDAAREDRKLKREVDEALDEWEHPPGFEARRGAVAPPIEPGGSRRLG